MNTTADEGASSPASESHREGLLTTEDLAAYLQITVRSIEDWRTHGYGPPPIRIGRRVRYRRSTVDAWLQQLEQSQ